MYTPSKELETLNKMDFSAKSYTNTKMKNYKRYGIDKGSQLISLINKNEPKYIAKKVWSGKNSKSNSVDINDISMSSFNSKDTSNTGNSEWRKSLTRTRRVSLVERTINETKKSQCKLI